MPDHLLLPERTTIGSRRAGGGGGPTPTRNPRRHGEQLAAGLTAARAIRRLDVGVDPDLVFKIRAERRLDDDTLIRRGLVPLSETSDYTYFVLTGDEGRVFEAALHAYAAGDDVEGAQARLSSLFGVIDAVESYGPEDRRGPGLDELPSGGMHIVDVVVWASPDLPEAQRRYQTVTAIVAGRQGAVLLSDLRPRRTVLRVRVDSGGLDDLLNTSVVERVRTPRCLTWIQATGVRSRPTTWMWSARTPPPSACSTTRRP